MNRTQRYLFMIAALAILSFTYTPDIEAMHGPSGQNTGFFASVGAFVGNSAGTFFSAAASNFAKTSTTSVYKPGDIARMGNDAMKYCMDEIGRMDTGPAIQEFKRLIADNKKAIIRELVYYALAASALTATALGMQYATYFIWRYGSEIVAKYVLMSMEKPRIIINSSKQENSSYIKRIINFIRGVKRKEYPEMVFNSDVAQQLEDMVKQTQLINTAIKSGKKNIVYRNLLLEGPPGTGKTMFARKLARESGLEWVEITGSSLFTKGAGLAAIDELFAWAGKSSRGLLIFIDEADSLFPDRKTMDPNSENYKIINHFLNYLGTKSNTFMIVMSTNHKVTFDEAMRRRIHDVIHLPLPGFEQRVKLLELYAQKILFNDAINAEAFTQSAQQIMTPVIIQDIATKTVGFSSDEMATLVETIKSLADISQDGLVTTVIVERAVKRQLDGRQGFSTSPIEPRIAV